MKSREEVIAFDEALDSVPRILSQEDLKQLYLVFDDRCLHHEVMWGLVHCVESFDAKDRLLAFVDTVPQLVKQANEWTETILVRTLNNKDTREILQAVLAEAELASRREVEGLLKALVENTKEPLAGYATSLLQKLR